MTDKYSTNTARQASRQRDYRIAVAAVAWQQHAPLMAGGTWRECAACRRNTRVVAGKCGECGGVDYRELPY